MFFKKYREKYQDRKTVDMEDHRFIISAIIFSYTLFFLFVMVALGYITRSKERIWPIPQGSVQYIDKAYAVEVERKNIDTLVGDYVDKYFTQPGRRSEMRMIMHCLLNRETKHDLDKGHGDGGRAGGSLQFHQPTWEGYRKIMIKRGLVNEVGSRYKLEQAIETTVWAISDGRALAWGPILRWSNGKAYQHACPKPSWY